jgi:hypothetical protein
MALAAAGLPLDERDFDFTGSELASSMIGRHLLCNYDEEDNSISK